MGSGNTCGIDIKIIIDYIYVHTNIECDEASIILILGGYSGDGSLLSKAKYVLDNIKGTYLR